MCRRRQRYDAASAAAELDVEGLHMLQSVLIVIACLAGLATLLVVMAMLEPEHGKHRSAP
jgi:hypothetical protein